MISVVSPASGVLEHLNICLRALLRLPLSECGRESEGESVDTFLLIGLNSARPGGPVTERSRGEASGQPRSARNSRICCLTSYGQRIWVCINFREKLGIRSRKSSL